MVKSVTKKVTTARTLLIEVNLPRKNEVLDVEISWITPKKIVIAQYLRKN
jgi:hypothetical protein